MRKLKFKVGDMVSVNAYKEAEGKEYTVVTVDATRPFNPYFLHCNNGQNDWFKEEDMELLVQIDEHTYVKKPKPENMYIVATYEEHEDWSLSRPLLAPDILEYVTSVGSSTYRVFRECNIDVQITEKTGEDYAKA